MLNLELRNVGNVEIKMLNPLLRSASSPMVRTEQWRADTVLVVARGVEHRRRVGIDSGTKA